MFRGAHKEQVPYNYSRRHENEHLSFDIACVNAHFHITNKLFYLNRDRRVTYTFRNEYLFIITYYICICTATINIFD